MSSTFSSAQFSFGGKGSISEQPVPNFIYIYKCVYVHLSNENKDVENGWTKAIFGNVCSAIDIFRANLAVQGCVQQGNEYLCVYILQTGDWCSYFGSSGLHTSKVSV